MALIQEPFPNQDQVDMDDLYDILWQQDMDMGMGRDFFNPDRQVELQKEQEIAAQKQLQKEKHEEQLKAMMFATDAETGEKIPIDDPLAAFYQYQKPKPISPSTDFLNPGFDPEVPIFVLDELQKLLETQSQEPPAVYNMIQNNNPEQHKYCVEKPALPEIKTEASELEDFWDMDTGDSSMRYPHPIMDLNYYNMQQAPPDHTQHIGMLKPPVASLSQGSPMSSTDDGYSSPTKCTSWTETNHFDFNVQDLKPFKDTFNEVRPAVDKDSILAKRRRCKDNERCKFLNIPLTVNEIVELPVEEFNDMLKSHNFNEDQLSVVRDIRRRGKNKVAAQNCRKKKLNELTDLEEEIEEMKKQKQKLQQEKMMFQNNRDELRGQVEKTYMEIFMSLRDANGHPYDPRLYTLDMNDAGIPTIQRMFTEIPVM